MRFGTRRLLPHRAVTTFVIALIAVVTIGSGVARALPPATDDSVSSPYKIEVSATRVDALFNFFLTVRSRADDQVVQTAHLKSRIDEWATATYRHMDTAGQHDISIRAKGRADGTAIIETAVDGAAPTIQTITPKSAHAVSKVEKRPDTISIDLKDADIRDVLRTFSKLTNTEMIVDDDVTGRTSITLNDTPWTEALEILLRQNNLRQERAGNTVYVHRK